MTRRGEARQGKRRLNERRGEERIGEEMRWDKMSREERKVLVELNWWFGTIFNHYWDCIIGAEKEMLIAAGFWRPSKAVNIIVNALHELNSRLSQRGGSKVNVKVVSLLFYFIFTKSIFVLIFWDKSQIWGRGFLKYQKIHTNIEKRMQKLSFPSAQQVPFLNIEMLVSLTLFQNPLFCCF